MQWSRRRRGIEGSEKLLRTVGVEEMVWKGGRIGR